MLLNPTSISTLSLLLHIKICLAQAQKDFPSARLHENENKSGKSIDFFEYSKKFYEDIQKLIDSQGLEKAALFCANGVFILYNGDHFSSNSDSEVQILAGTQDTCIPPGHTKSLRFIQRVSAPVSTSYLAIFAKDRFGSQLHDIISESSHTPKFHIVNSFILMGNEGWTVTTSQGVYCFKTGNPAFGKYQVCPVSNTGNILKQNRDDQHWLLVTRGCSTEAVIILLKYCFDRGSGQMESIVGEQAESDKGFDKKANTGEELVPLKNTTSADTTDTSTMSCDDYTYDFTMLLRLRLTHDFDNMYQVQFPLNKLHSWRTEILDNTMEIVAAATKANLIRPRILRYVREMYIYLAENLVWSKGTGWPPKPKQRILLLGHQTKRCLIKLRKMEEQNSDGVTKEISQRILQGMKSANIPEEDIREELRTVEGNDIVMEFIWLSINFVGAACSETLEFKTDFWIDFIGVAYDMYLKPMTSFWGNPGRFLKYYPILLGGYDIANQLKGLAATTSVLYTATSLDVLPRPRGVMKEDAMSIEMDLSK